MKISSICFIILFFYSMSNISSAADVSQRGFVFGYFFAKPLTDNGLSIIKNILDANKPIVIKGNSKSHLEAIENKLSTYISSPNVFKIYLRNNKKGFRIWCIVDISTNEIIILDKNNTIDYFIKKYTVPILKYVNVSSHDMKNLLKHITMENNVIEDSIIPITDKQNPFCNKPKELNAIVSVNNTLVNYISSNILENMASLLCCKNLIETERFPVQLSGVGKTIKFTTINSWLNRNKILKVYTYAGVYVPLFYLLDDNLVRFYQISDRSTGKIYAICLSDEEMSTLKYLLQMGNVQRSKDSLHNDND